MPTIENTETTQQTAITCPLCHGTWTDSTTYVKHVNNWHCGTAYWGELYPEEYRKMLERAARRRKEQNR